MTRYSTQPSRPILLVGTTVIQEDAEIQRAATGSRVWASAIVQDALTDAVTNIAKTHN